MSRRSNGTGEGPGKAGASAPGCSCPAQLVLLEAPETDPRRFVRALLAGQDPGPGRLALVVRCTCTGAAPLSAAAASGSSGATAPGARRRTARAGPRK